MVAAVSKIGVLAPPLILLVLLYVVGAISIRCALMTVVPATLDRSWKDGHRGAPSTEPDVRQPTRHSIADPDPRHARPDRAPSGSIQLGTTGVA
ncbi:hypothetical protein [Actinomadura sp. NEAU-AAG7]|uniref:hypothetical protein n=1 Tax=Actinomadura sp. NEAU-AAG7 TaxID=2839640 RepID=UPI001BE42633|nr:hypothetical protein [Actinomadura sp. NEAU-AAG7]MBT2214104.1 hypothetical protein [Actinomadura sp. NEAU-AAG7]